MKKQQKTYVLLFAVLVIWGLIGYQIYTRMNPPVPKIESTKISNGFVREINVDQSFYELKATYRDPFLGKYPAKKSIKKTITKPKKNIPYPRVIYNGMIEGSSSKTFILTVNNQQEILKLGESIQKVKLLKADSKEAIVVFEGNKKTILLNQ